MAEPQCDHRTVDAAVKKLHGARMAKRMDSDTFLGQGGALGSCGGQMLGQYVGEAVMAERAVTLIGEDGVGRLARAFSQPRS